MSLSNMPKDLNFLSPDHDLNPSLVVETSVVVIFIDLTYLLKFLQIGSAMDYSDMDSDSEEEERRRREMEDLLYSQVHHQEEGDATAAAAVEDVALRDVGAATRESSPRRTETEEVASSAVSAADSGVASLAASSPEPEFVDLASSDSDDDGIQGGRSWSCCANLIFAE